MSLPESRLYTFLDEPREFALYFLEGQRLVRDLALKTGVQGGGFAYLRDVLLSVQPMIALLKGGEQLGFYLDSERPFFRLKIEAAHHGDVRCALVPETFRDFPDAMWGTARLLKLFPGNRAPYQSVLRIEGLPLGEIVNRVLANSYQVNSAVLVSQRADRSAMLHQLPPIPHRETYEYSGAALGRRRVGIEERLRDVLARPLEGDGDVTAAFSALGFRRLADRRVRLYCACTRERMIRGILSIANASLEELFDPGQTELAVTCQYCRAGYRIPREELLRAENRPH